MMGHVTIGFTLWENHQQQVGGFLHCMLVQGCKYLLHACFAQLEYGSWAISRFKGLAWTSFGELWMSLVVGYYTINSILSTPIMTPTL